jgi:MFS family permease
MARRQPTETHLTDHGSGDDRVGTGDYGFLLFLTLLNVMNFVDRQLLASFANDIVPDLGLSNTEFGLLTGFGFIVFYAVMGLFAGALSDRVHRPRLVAAALTLWSVLTAASGAARGFLSLLAPRMFIGVGESVLTPASMSMLSDRFPPSKMGFASGFYYMGVPIGVALSLLIKGYVGPAIGWRNCFYALGAIGVALALVMLFVKEKRTPRAQPPPDASSPKPPLVRSLWTALTSTPALVFTICGGVAFHFILGAAAFDQLWFVEERGFDKDRIAQLSGWIGMGAGIAGNLFGGFAGDWWQRNTSSGRPMFLFWISLAFTPIGFLYRIVDPQSILFFVAIGAGYFQLGCFYGPTFATVQELAPAEIRGTIVGFYLLMLNLVGLGIGITGGGVMIDVLAEAGYAEPYSMTLLAFTGFSSLAIPCFWIAGRRFFSDRDRVIASRPSSSR